MLTLELAVMSVSAAAVAEVRRLAGEEIRTLGKGHPWAGASIRRLIEVRVTRVDERSSEATVEQMLCGRDAAGTPPAMGWRLSTRPR